jgi:hypothetical protein
MKKLAKSMALALIAIYAISLGGGLYGAFHGHDASDPSCQCQHCHHEDDLSDTSATTIPSQATSEGLCQICSVVDGLLKLGDLETVLDDDPIVKAVFHATECNPYILCLERPPELRYISDPSLQSPHLLFISSVIIRC